MIPQDVEAWLTDNNFGFVEIENSVTGGCINNGVQIATSIGESFFLKTNPTPPPDMFEREYEGLIAINKNNSLKIPKPYHFGSNFILMEDLKPAQKIKNYWETFGRLLASLHNYKGEQFGFSSDNYIGRTPQVNTWTSDGFIFFKESRIRYIAEMVRKKGLIGDDIHHRILNLSNRITTLVPEQPPSLIHGDLWSGNAITDSTGGPAIIDPAVNYGWAEAELAMTTLFGSFPEKFYESYIEVNQLEPGYQSRFPFYNIYHVLNHVLLFGRGYLGMVIDILNLYE